MPENLDFKSSSLASTAYDQLPDSVNIPEYQAIANVFRANMTSVRVLGDLPAELNFWSMIVSNCRIHAKYMLGAQHTDVETSKDIELSDTLFREWKQRRALVTSRPVSDEVSEIGHHNFAALIDSDTSGDLRIAAEAILSAMVTESWAAFEALAIDLWVSALNKHPKSLAKRYADRNGEKNISLSQLGRFDYDLSQNMGTILKLSRKISFDSFDDLKSGYADAFGESVKAVFDLQPNLRIAEKTRHLLAHRSGYADAQFLADQAVTKFFPNVDMGKRILLTGNAVAEMVSSCVLCGVDLLNFADKWAAENPN